MDIAISSINNQINFLYLQSESSNEPQSSTPGSLPRDGNTSVAINIDPMSPSSLKLPSLSSWDVSNSTRSPALYAPPDMNSMYQ